MIVQPAKSISPQERAKRLGLDPAAFGEFTMSVAAADAVDRIKKSDRSNWKVRVLYHVVGRLETEGVSLKQRHTATV